MPLPVLVLVNGGPAAGKSTLARAWAARHPLALALDVDVVRAMLGDWRGDPHEAGLAARRLALAMAREHLVGGRDVIVPQFTSRSGLTEQLAAVAREAGATFVEVVLDVDPAEAERRFAARAAGIAPEAALQRPLGAPMAELVAEVDAFVRTRPGTVRLADGDGLLERLERTIAGRMGG